MRWRWYGLLILLLSIPAFALSWLTLTDAGLQWVYQQARPYLPAAVHVGRIQGRLLGPLEVSDFSYLSDDVAVSTPSIQVDWTVSALLSGYVDITRLGIDQLSVVLPEKPQSGTHQSKDMAFSIRFPWRVDLRELLVNELSVQQPSGLSRIKQVKATARAQFNQLNIDELIIEAERYSLGLGGYLQTDGGFKHALQLHWQVTLPSEDILGGQGELAGDIHRTQITQKLVTPQALNLNGELFDLLQQPHWQATVDVPGFDSARWKMALPELKGTLRANAKGDLKTATISGQLEGRRNDVGPFSSEFQLQWLADQSLKLDKVSIYQSQQQTQIDASGMWRPGSKGGDIDLALQWSNLRWPMQEEPWFSSSSGQGSVQGGIDAYRFEISTDKPLSQLPASSWYARGSGNQQKIQFDQLRISALEGEIKASGELDWSSQLAWKAEVEASQLNPAALYPDWPGKLDTRLSHRGHLIDGQIAAEVDIKRLDGILRNYPVTLTSQLAWRDQGVDIKGLEFHSGSSLLTGQGRIDQNLRVEWKLSSDNLAELYPGAGGQLRASGRLSGQREAPGVKASLNGKSLTYQDYRMADITAEMTLNVADLLQSDVKLQASGLTYNQYLVNQLNITGNTRQLRVKASSGQLQSDLEFKGEASTEGWQGQVVRASLSSDVFKQWHLQAPVKLSINASALQLGQACWQNTDLASLCVTLEQQNNVWRSQLALGKFPLQTFKNWLPTDLDVDALTNATAQFELATQKLKADARIDLLPGTIVYPLLDGELEQWLYQGGQVELSLNDEGLQSKVELKVNDSDHIQGEFSLPGVDVFALDMERQVINGKARMTIGDLNPMASMIPEVQRLRGQASLDMALAGTLSQPKFSGQATLQQGSFSIPRLGLNITELAINSTNEGFDKIQFSLDARSGDGTLRVDGVTQLDKAAGWPTEIAITGKEFEVSQIPEARILATPDLKIKLRQSYIGVSGQIEVPYAHLQPRDISTATRVSSDVVILGQEQPQQQKWIIESRVQLVLGDRVHFYGFGFEGRLGGGLLLEDEPGQPTRATGDITIPEGRYRAYGQQLDVEHGRLLFAGGPLTNPGLDIRAVRKVNTITVGLKVRGTVSQPQIELFSIPAMGQTDTLSYLLLGRPMENASNEEGAMLAKATLALGLTGGDRLARTLGEQFGLDEMRVESSSSGDQASLVVGRYLSPRLYVSYGIGLIETFNTFNVRYQISDKWQLKAESGESQGADILYTFERE